MGVAFGIFSELKGFFLKTFFILFTLLTIGVVGFFYLNLSPTKRPQL